MAEPGAGKLYTPEILALAVSLADYPLDDRLSLRGEARAATCGSTLHLALAVDGDQRIEQIGLRVSACAIGQAAAALFAKGAVGLSSNDLVHKQQALIEWLAGEGPMPAWPDLDLLEPARAYPARHGAILLAWKAAAGALCKDAAER